MVRVTKEMKAKVYKTIYGAFRAQYGRDFPLVDLTERVKVEIKVGQAARGIAGDCRHCILSDGACIQNGYNDAFTSPTQCILIKDGIAYKGVLTAEEKMNIKIFDDTGKMEPGVYWIIQPRTRKTPTHHHGPRKPSKKREKLPLTRSTTIYHPHQQNFEVPTEAVINA